MYMDAVVIAGIATVLLTNDGTNLKISGFIEMIRYRRLHSIQVC